MRDYCIRACIFMHSERGRYSEGVYSEESGGLLRGKSHFTPTKVKVVCRGECLYILRIYMQSECLLMQEVERFRCLEV